MSGACPVVRPKSDGEPCGRRVVAFVAPGEGRCGYHNTIRERVRALALRRAVRDLRQLRAVGPDHREDDAEPGGDEQPESGVRFDAERFAGPELDE